MNINPDFVLYIAMIGSTIIGFAFGRFERKDSYTRTYRHGFNVGKQVGRRESHEEAQKAVWELNRSAR